MAEQLVNDGEIVTTESGVQLQCVSVRHEESAEGVRSNYEYIFREVNDISNNDEGAQV